MTPTLPVPRGARLWFPVLALAGTALLCAACGSGGSDTATTAAKAVPGTGPDASVTNCLTADSCYSAQQIRTAYGIQPLLNRGIDGQGQTVTLVEVAAGPEHPPEVTSVSQDINGFDSLNYLAQASIQIVGTLDPSASPGLGDAQEIQDIEMVHAVAPAASLSVILISQAAEADPRSLVDTVSSAVTLGLTRSAVMAISGSFGEHCFNPAEVAHLQSALLSAQAHHVTVIGASGDAGATGEPCPGSSATPPVKEVGLPAADPLVLAVGGTTLTLDRTSGLYVHETAWNTPPDPPVLTHSQASGGGFSRLFPRPAYQDGVAGAGPGRGVPDVAADASPGSGLSLVLGSGARSYHITSATGTGAAAALWAGLVALADQEAGRDLGFINPAVYAIGRSASSGRAFHDITEGDNSVVFPTGTIVGYQAARGWDPVTGWGSPNGQVLVPLLARGG